MAGKLPLKGGRGGLCGQVAGRNEGRPGEDSSRTGDGDKDSVLGQGQVRFPSSSSALCVQL